MSLKELLVSVLLALGSSSEVDVGGSCVKGGTCVKDDLTQTNQLAATAALPDTLGLIQSGTVLARMHGVLNITPTDLPNEDTSQKESALDVVKKASSLRPAFQKLLEDNVTSEDIKEILGAGFNPQMSEIIKGMIDTITTQIKGKVLSDQTTATKEVTKRIKSLNETTDSAVVQKDLADKADTAHDQCVASERGLVVAYETCKAEEATLKLEKPSVGYCGNPAFNVVYPKSQTLIAHLETSLNVDSGDFSKGILHVKQVMDTYLQPMKDWIDVQKAKAVTDQESWGTANQQCNDKTKELEDKTKECGTLLAAWRTHHEHCLHTKSAQTISLCVFGYKYQAKCVAKDEYDTLILDVTGSGTSWSESDRKLEWRHANRLSCVLTIFMTTTTLTTGAVETCTKTDSEAAANFTAGVGHVDLQDGKYTLLTSEAKFTCDEADIMFGSGVLWTVPENTADDDDWVANSADYTKTTGHKYAIESDSSLAPFDICLKHSGHVGAPTCGSAFECGARTQKLPATKCYAEVGCTTADCCVKKAVCGDHVLDANEDCDDGSTAAMDGCSATCTTEAACTVPSIPTSSVLGWTGGATCASGANNVFQGTNCQIEAAGGHTCTSPGLCGEDGNFAATGACQAILCGANHKVLNHGCETCPIGKTSTGNHDASGSDTSCDAKYCGQGERVVINKCEACPTGKTSPGEHDASGSDTECEAAAAPVAIVPVQGPFNTNLCPSGSVPITTVSECQEAADTNGWVFTLLTKTNRPTGCFLFGVNNYIYFNTYSSGVVSPSFAPLCKAGGAPVTTCENQAIAGMNLIPTVSSDKCAVSNTAVTGLAAGSLACKVKCDTSFVAAEYSLTCALNSGQGAPMAATDKSANNVTLSDAICKSAGTCTSLDVCTSQGSQAKTTQPAYCSGETCPEPECCDMVAQYVANAANTNVCPTGYRPTVTKAECQEGIVFLKLPGRQYIGAGAWSSNPKGCLFYSDDSSYDVYLNIHATGAPSGNQAMICKVAGCSDWDVRLTDIDHSGNSHPSQLGKVGSPQVYKDGGFHPVCGPSFWDTANSAKTFCRQLGFDYGYSSASNEQITQDAMYVQLCGVGLSTLQSCADGGDVPTGTMDKASCAAGQPVGVRVTCVGSSAFSSFSSCSEA